MEDEEFNGEVVSEECFAAIPVGEPGEVLMLDNNDGSFRWVPA